MRITRTADDPVFRKVAKAVRLCAEDMIPLEGLPGAWCLPLEQIEASPSIKLLRFRFDETKLDGIIQRRQAEQPTKRITLRRGPDIILFSKATPPVPENEFVVMIALENPSIPLNITGSTFKRRRDGDGIVTGEGMPTRQAENASSHVLQPHQKTGQDNGNELAATNEEQKKVERTTEAPPEPSPQGQAFVETLRREAEIVVSTLIDGGEELLDLNEGDFLELDVSEYLQPKAGFAGGVVMVYNWS